LAEERWESLRQRNASSLFVSFVISGCKENETVRSEQSETTVVERSQPIPPSAPMFWYCSIDDRMRLTQTHTHTHT